MNSIAVAKPLWMGRFESDRHVEPEEQERDTHQERQHDHDDLTVATTESLHFV